MFQCHNGPSTKGYHPATGYRSINGMCLKSLDRSGQRGSWPTMESLSDISNDRIRLFRSGFLERLTVISGPVFMSIWAILLPAIAVMGAVSAATLWAPALIIAGLIFWTVTEYVLHRFVFHFETESQLMQRMVFIIHGNHHADPNDPLRNLMPPIVSIPVGCAIWAMCLWAFGPVGTWVLLGFMTGYVAYDLVHYACHQWPMKGAFTRMLKSHHMRHHHVHVHGNYAITGMIWDRVLATRILSVKERT